MGNTYWTSIRTSELWRKYGETILCSIFLHNDHIGVYGLIMTKGGTRDVYERLAEGCTSCRHLDDPLLGLKNMFQNIVVEFNNEKIMVQLLDESNDTGITPPTSVGFNYGRHDG